MDFKETFPAGKDFADALKEYQGNLIFTNFPKEIKIPFIKTFIKGILKNGRSGKEKYYKIENPNLYHKP
ncbi:hypothetical protein [Fusicatenibacter faecihominis]|uniref:Uncharacterized protein n=1 Tax=Fusicatenibacter faecihominis TaxID=2881276 RepID=A0AAE3DTN9_9FIRM|nr:hypothetical protein [Fusicatenibacter faecihominis]MCC2190447.1 hypothetical protein [Fusicatenibacter faecihominis]